VQYRRRLRDEPGAVNNLYFAYMLSLNAVADMEERLTTCNFLGEGAEVQPLITELLGSTTMQNPAVTKAADRIREKTDAGLAWQARLRTRDLLRIMNCVQCSLCKLHGKVSALGLSATLQVILGEGTREGDQSALSVSRENPTSPYSLHRVEVAALLTYTAKLAEACATVERFAEKDAAAVEQTA